MSLAAFFCLGESGSTGLAVGMAAPSRFGSASVSGPSRPLPRKTTTKRCPLPGLMRTSVSPIFLIFFESSAQRSWHFSVSIRPARRSVTIPRASSVQKLARAAAGRDSGGDRNHPTLRGILREGVQVRRDRRFQGCRGVRTASGDIAEAVEYNQRQFRAGFNAELGVKAVEI